MDITSKRPGRLDTPGSCDCSEWRVGDGEEQGRKGSWVLEKKIGDWSASALGLVGSKK